MRGRGNRLRRYSRRAKASNSYHRIPPCRGSNLLPHYIHEGKSYLTIAFGCTGGQHRSVMIAEDVTKRLKKAGYRVKVVHRDSPK